MSVAPLPAAPNAPTLLSAWTAGRDRLRAAGVDQPVNDARTLLQRAARVERIEIVTDPHRAVGPEALLAYEAFIERRAGRTPLSHIVGSAPFWSFELEVTPDVLTPRRETEHVVEALLAHPAPETARVLDLGVGSGAILLALLAHRPGWFGIGVDRSAAAIAVARRNAGRLGLADRTGLWVGDWANALSGRFDLVAANPPYVATPDLAGLEPEARDHDPRLALDGGLDGYDAYRALAPVISRVLAPGGLAALEVGAGQALGVVAHLAAADPGLELDVRADLAGHDRVVLARRSARPRTG